MHFLLLLQIGNTKEFGTKLLLGGVTLTSLTEVTTFVEDFSITLPKVRYWVPVPNDLGLIKQNELKETMRIKVYGSGFEALLNIRLFTHSAFCTKTIEEYFSYC